MSTNFDETKFKHVLSHFATGVVAVCGNEAGELVGFAAQSFVSLSLAPPLILFCPQKSSSSWPRIRRLQRFCVNVFAEDQKDISEAFAVAGEVPAIKWHPHVGSNTPVLEGVIATIDCTLHVEHDAGDHTIVVAAVECFDTQASSSGKPLLYYQGTYGSFSPS